MPVNPAPRADPRERRRRRKARLARRRARIAQARKNVTREILTTSQPEREPTEDT